MEWLLTVAESTQPADVDEALARCGAALRPDLGSIPQDDGTKVLFAVGPPDLDSAVSSGWLPNVLHAHPSSAPEPL